MSRPQSIIEPFQGSSRKGKTATSNCCTWPKAFVFLFSVLAALITLFFIVSLEEVFKELLPNYDLQLDDGQTYTPTFSPTITRQPQSAEPTDYPEDFFQFNQCKGEDECCNGLTSNCALRVNELMFATLHNANHHEPPKPSHNLPLEESLNAGYRGLMLDLCWCDDTGKGIFTYVFCHSVCSLGRRNITEVITNIVSFLEKETTELIMINLELSDTFTSTNQTLTEFWDFLNTNVDNLNEMVYVKENTVDWPTMSELQNQTKQLIFFKHRGKDCFENEGYCPVGGAIHELFDYSIETTYTLTSESINNFNESCRKDRGYGNDFYNVNHFVTVSGISSEDAAIKINQLDFLKKRLSECEDLTNRIANMVNIDFWNATSALPKYAQFVNKNRAIKIETKDAVS